MNNVGMIEAIAYVFSGIGSLLFCQIFWRAYSEKPLMAKLAVCSGILYLGYRLAGTIVNFTFGKASFPL